MPHHRLHLVAGLGNPGEDYAWTRHNAGFLVIDAVTTYASLPCQKEKFKVRYGRGRVADREVILAKPQAFMNRSGPPLQQLAAYFRIPPSDMLVVHDDIDLDFGRLKIKEKGGHGGHKGVRSLIDALGADDFARLRVGIGRSEYQTDVVDHVLGRFLPAETERLQALLQRARDAVVTVLCKGTKEGMNRFNDRRIKISR